MNKRDLRFTGPIHASLLGVCLALLAGTSAIHAALSFAGYVAFPTGAWPEAVAIADLNGDGRNDVVMTTTSYGTSTNNNSVLVYFQNASGGLDVPVAYAAGAGAVSVAIADFNGDGQKDITVGKETVGIRVFWNAQGSFTSFTDYNTANALKICAGDFNHDGLPDLTGIGWGSSQVDVFTQGTGGLSFSGQYTASYGGYNDLEAADVNSDGWTDLVVMSGQLYATPNFSVLLQTQTGFAPAVPYDLGGNELTDGVGVGDLTGDGRNDVMVSWGGNRPAASITVFAQTSGGVLTRGSTYASYDIPGPLVVADMNLDGRPDLVTLHGGWRQAGVYLQTASGTLEA